MKPEEWAWLAGFLEGEGSFLTGTRAGKVWVRISVCSTDSDVLERVAAYTGVGSVLPVRVSGRLADRKPIWHWRIGGKADVKVLIETLLPLLGERRRRQAKSVLNAIGDPVTRPVGVCMRGHPLVGTNRLGGRAACRTCNLEAKRRLRSKARPATPRVQS